MRHDIGAALGHEPRGRRAHCLSAWERAALTAVARAAMPPGRVFPGGDERCVEKVDHFLALSPPSLKRLVQGALAALELHALGRHGTHVAALPVATLQALLERWRTGGVAQRNLLRLLVAPLKLAHYNDATMYRAVGCRWGTLPTVQEERPRWWARVTPASALPLEEEIECDVVVVGSGAGGAVMAKELAERGLAVVLVEEGDYHTRAEFSGHAVDMQRKLYRDMGATASIGNTWIPIPIGRSVGGTTTINSGTCFRTPERVLDGWARDLGLDELRPARMAPYFERVETVLEVAPAEPRYLGGVARVIARGCDALGFAHRPLARNAPGCDGQGVCCFGCPSDAKRSTNVSYVPLALKAGAQLYTGVRATRLLRDGDRVSGVELRAPGNGLGDKRLVVRARATVIACGTLLTPLLLEDNRVGLGSGQLGRNLSIHPAAAVLALYDEKLDGANAIPQGYSIEQFHDEGLLFEGAFGALDIAAASFPLIGPRLVELLERYDHMACFGVMIEDHSRGRVRRGPGGRPLITYVLDDVDTAKLKRAVDLLARVYFAGGARAVFPLVHGFDELRCEADLERLRAARLRARDFELSAYHPLGTARMGRDPRSSVVGPDQRVHGVDGLYVADGSVVPGSPGVNPQVTIMALATRAADGLAARLGA